MKNTNKTLSERILKNPSAYVARLATLESAREFQRKGKGQIIVKVNGQFWVTCGRYAGALNSTGFEYVK